MIRSRYVFALENQTTLPVEEGEPIRHFALILKDFRFGTKLAIYIRNGKPREDHADESTTVALVLGTVTCCSLWG